jgi:hypothetical protein
VCASGIWSLDHGTLYGNLPLAKRCVRPKTRIGSHGCVSMFTAVNLYVTLDHKTVKRWCDVQTETVWPGQGLWWLVLAGLRASCRCPSQHLASDVMSVNPRGTQSSGSNMWNVLRHDANWELSSWNNFDSEPWAKLEQDVASSISLWRVVKKAPWMWASGPLSRRSAWNNLGNVFRTEDIDLQPLVSA